MQHPSASRPALISHVDIKGPMRGLQVYKFGPSMRAATFEFQSQAPGGCPSLQEIYCWSLLCPAQGGPVGTSETWVSTGFLASGGGWLSGRS